MAALEQRHMQSGTALVTATYGVLTELKGSSEHPLGNAGPEQQSLNHFLLGSRKILLDVVVSIP